MAMPEREDSAAVPGATPRDRFLGCLLGGAVGDALGAPVEFLRQAEIRARFGDVGIRDYAPAYGRIGAITDDTQMTLFTAEAMIRTHMRQADRGIGSPVAVTAHAYQRWLRTQGERSACDCERSIDSYPGWLFGLKALHQRRAPGNTCLSALRRARSFGERADNDSKGCGAVMRAAPVGLAGWRFGVAASGIFEAGAEIGRLTHGHPSGYLPAGALAAMVAAILGGAGLAAAAEGVLGLLRAQTGHAETVSALELVLRLAANSRPASGVPRELGEGWVGEEALAIALYCGLVARGFEDGVLRAVNIDGDSDSTGAIAGNLLGVLFGAAAIPRRWLDHLELGAEIATLAGDLHDCTAWDLHAAGKRAAAAREERFARYPPN